MGETTFLFPGQGSQSVGMLAELAAGAGVVRETFEEASEALGLNLWALSQQGPAEELNRTEVTQPAMLAGDIAAWRAWQQAGGQQPSLMAGHSLGEYAALVAAGALEFSDGIRLVAERGRLMQAAVPEGVGAMAAIIGLDDQALEAVCVAQASGQVLSCANFNAPGQIVIAGHAEAVGRACEAARAAGAKRALPLPVSVPSHCLLMREAAEQLASTLADSAISAPAVPVIQNADVASFDNAEAIRDALARQLWQPVQWTRTIGECLQRGAGRFIECGPGRVLTGLNRRITRESETIALTDTETIRTTIGDQQA